QVYTLSKEGKALCLDAAKGTVVWEKDLAKQLGAKKPEWGFSGAVLVEGDIAVYNLGSAGTGENKESEEVVWKSDTTVAGYSQPIPFDMGKDRLVVFMAASDAIALHPKTGSVAWSQPWKTSYDINAADPIIEGNKVFVSSGYNHGASVFE